MFRNLFNNFARVTGLRVFSNISALAWIFRRNELKTVSAKNAVFITGCDSGLGFNLALFCHSLNMTVITGLHSMNSEGAKILQCVPNSERMIPIEIDITKRETISKAHDIIKKLIAEQNLEFTALVNNAGIMCFGEFEWQTPKIFESQIDVNLLGPMRVTHELLPLIRQHHSRIINVTSHCGLQALPSLSPYTASKAGLRFWTEAIRMELKKYGIKVVNFIPGSFVAFSNIASMQKEFADEMWHQLSGEQKEFYGDYFRKYNTYLSVLPGKQDPIKIEDKKLFAKFENALLCSHPCTTYRHEPLRYKIYHWLFKISPTSLHDYFIQKFLCMPPYSPREKNQ